MSSIKNVRCDEQPNSAEGALATAILDEYTRNHGELPEHTRIVIIVATGTDLCRIGCAFEGYDEDERLMVDLSMLARAIDLGPEGGR